MMKSEITRTYVKEVGMLAVFMSNSMLQAGIVVSIVACVMALKKAGQSGEHETPMDAANSQETWANAYDYQKELDSRK